MKGWPKPVSYTHLLVQSALEGNGLAAQILHRKNIGTDHGGLALFPGMQGADERVKFAHLLDVYKRQRSERPVVSMTVGIIISVSFGQMPFPALNACAGVAPCRNRAAFSGTGKTRRGRTAPARLSQTFCH